MHTLVVPVSGLPSSTSRLIVPIGEMGAPPIPVKGVPAIVRSIDDTFIALKVSQVIRFTALPLSTRNLLETNPPVEVEFSGDKSKA